LSVVGILQPIVKKEGVFRQSRQYGSKIYGRNTLTYCYNGKLFETPNYFINMVCKVKSH